MPTRRPAPPGEWETPAADDRLRCEHRHVGDREPRISIELSPAQVREVLRAASTRGPGGVLGPAPSRPGLAQWAASARRLAEVSQDARLSRSLLRGLSILALLESPPPERGIVEIASELGLSAATAHRYAQTLLAVGLLERCPDTRRYRLSRSGVR
jgi:hypothetical protein